MRVILVFILFTCVCSVISGTNEDILQIDSKDVENNKFLVEAKYDIERLLRRWPKDAGLEDEILAPSVNIYEPKPLNLINRMEQVLTRLGARLKELNEYEKGPSKGNLRHAWYLRNAPNDTSNDELVRTLTTVINEAFEKRLQAKNELIKELEEKLNEQQELINGKRTGGYKTIRHHHIRSHDLANKAAIADKILDRFMTSYEPDRLELVSRARKFKPIHHRNDETSDSDSDIIDSDGYNDLTRYLDIYKGKGRTMKRETKDDKLDLINNEKSKEPVVYLRPNKEHIGTETRTNNNFKETSDVAVPEIKPFVQLVDKHNLKEKNVSADNSQNSKDQVEHEHRNKTSGITLRTRDSLDDEQLVFEVVKHLNSHRDEKGEEYNENYDFGKLRERSKYDTFRRLLERLHNKRVSYKNTHRDTSNDEEEVSQVNHGKELDKRSDIPTEVFGERDEDHKRHKRSTTHTQAGYTQDPDTCKTYNENLVKLWANLSQYINVTEQPDERALHNIAIMIQAYLDHQQPNSLAEFSNPNDGEEGNDKIFDVIVKIKKMFDEEEATPAKITKIITQEIKPHYGEVENDECQIVNEESLTSSIELLFKNYQENAKCLNGDDGDNDDYNRIGKSLRKQSPKKSSSNWHPNGATHNNAESLSIINENEFQRDYARGKTFRFGPSRRARSKKNQRSRKLSRENISDELNESLSYKTKTRSKPKIQKTNRRPKKNSLKTDVVKGKCESHAIRKFTISLRPIIERFTALLECQLDNTLRSVNYQRVIENPYYLYAYKVKSLRDNDPKLKYERPRTGKKKKKAKRKHPLITRHGRSDEEHEMRLVKRNRHPVLRKNDLKKLRGMKTASTAGISHENSKEVNSKIVSDYGTAYNEYLQSPPLYDDYDALFKANADSSYDSPKNAASKKKNKESLPLRDNDYHVVYDDEYNVHIQHATEDPDNFYEVDPEKLNKPISQIPTVTTQPGRTIMSFESMADFLKKARDVSMRTPEFAIPFALDTGKGYVELTHLVKYPKVLVYRPQFLIKNTIPYETFLKFVNHVNMTTDDAKLMKIARHLPDNTVKVLFETEDFDSPLEIQDVIDIENKYNDVKEYNPLQTRIGTEGPDESNTDLKQGNVEDYRSVAPGGNNRNVIDLRSKTIDLTDTEENPPPAKLVLREATAGEPQSFEFVLPDLSNVDPRLIPILTPILPDESDTGVVSQIVSAVGSKVGSDIGPSTVTVTSTLSSFTQTIPPTTDSQTETNSISVLPSESLNVTEDIPTAPQSSLRRWWNKWKKALMGKLKGKVKKITSEVASATKNADHIIELPRA